MHQVGLKSISGEEAADRTDSALGPLTPAEQSGGMRLSMHDGVAVSCDCCSCEAEPYWLAVGDPSVSEPDESPGQ
jgi:hypothetical protein